MNHPRKSTSNRGYQLTPDAVRILQENRPVPLQFTHKGAALVLDHKRGLMNADVNILPTSSAATKPYVCPPLSKGEQLEMLMDAGERLHKRFHAAYTAIYALPEKDYEGRNAAFKKLKRVENASDRITRKITELLTGKAPIFSPCPAQFLGTLKNSQLKAAREEAHALWVNYWDSDLSLFDAAYGDISEKLNLINDEIEKRSERGNWS